MATGRQTTGAGPEVMSWRFHISLVSIDCLYQQERSVSESFLEASEGGVSMDSGMAKY
jgi:hypothetical protein